MKKLSLIILASLLLLPSFVVAQAPLSKQTQDLFAAIKRHDLTGVEDAVIEGADVNARFGENEETPIVYAMRMTVRENALKTAVQILSSFISLGLAIGLLIPTLSRHDVVIQPRFLFPLGVGYSLIAVSGILAGSIQPIKFNTNGLEIVRYLALNPKVDLTLRTKRGQTVFDFFFQSFINLHKWSNMPQVKIPFETRVLILGDLEYCLYHRRATVDKPVVSLGMSLLNAIDEADDELIDQLIEGDYTFKVLLGSINMSINELGDTPLMYAIKKFASKSRGFFSNSKKPSQSELNTDKQFRVILALLRAPNLDFSTKNYSGLNVLDLITRISATSNQYVKSVLLLLKKRIKKHPSFQAAPATVVASE